MGKLNIAHHKSYHPYRRDNIERVRQDEEEAQMKEEREEGRMVLADSEARIKLLRERAGSSKSKRKLEEEREKELLEQATAPRQVVSSNTTANGHINFFEDLEQGAATSSFIHSRELDKLAKGKGKESELEKGFPLAPSAKDLKPWYSAKDIGPETEVSDDKRKKDLSHKSMSDPLTSINRQLASRYPSSSSPAEQSRHFGGRNHRPSSTSVAVDRPEAAALTKSELQSRLERESSERQRALELIRRKKLEAMGSETPSTVHGGYKYGNQFNRREVDEAHAHRDRGRRKPDVRDRSW